MLDFLTNEKLEELKDKGFTVIFYYYDSICYENSSENLKFSVITNSRKTDSFYFVLTKGNNLFKTQNLGNFSKEILTLKVSCMLNFEEEIDLEKKSYSFQDELPEILLKRMRTTFYDVPTEVLIFKEKEILNYMKTDLKTYI